MKQLIFALLSIIFFLACNDNNVTMDYPEVNSFKTDNGEIIPIKNDDQIQKLVTSLSSEKGELITTKLTELTTTSGETFMAFTNKFKHKDGIITTIIPLVLDGSSYSTQGCEMKCTSAWGCGSCKQTIETPCQSQTCECKTEVGGCSSKISFPELTHE